MHIKDKCGLNKIFRRNDFASNNNEFVANMYTLEISQIF